VVVVDGNSMVFHAPMQFLQFISIGKPLRSMLVSSILWIHLGSHMPLIYDRCQILFIRPPLLMFFSCVNN
jgi:hypothetical protein